jgi:hypothetical protein
MRAKTAEALMLGRSATEAVAAYYSKNQAVPPSLAEAGFTTTSPAVQGIAVNPKGVVTVTMAAPLTGKTLAFYPSMDEAKRIKWRCASDDIQAKHLPASCRP